MPGYVVSGWEFSLFLFISKKIFGVSILVYIFVLTKLLDKFVR